MTQWREAVASDALVAVSAVVVSGWMRGMRRDKFGLVKPWLDGTTQKRQNQTRTRLGVLNGGLRKRKRRSGRLARSYCEASQHLA